MSKSTIAPTNVERYFKDNEIIVSKTDLKGKITYINTLFESLSGYSRSELLGQPHNLIRHPDMPRSIFHLAWETLQQGHEIFAYVKNMCKNGDHYWVLAHMVPSYDLDSHHVGYHSNRRLPQPKNVSFFEGLYHDLIQIEQQATSPKAGIEKARKHLEHYLDEQKLSYDEFIFSLN